MSVSGAPQPTFQPLRAALRPPRAVVVIDGGDNWLSNAALGMYSCGRIWGGSGFLLIPHHDGEISRSIRRLARAYDPDYVVTLPMTIGQFEAINPEVLRLTVDGRLVEAAERAALIEKSKDSPVNNLAAQQARKLLASDCNPHRQLLEGRNSDDDDHHEQTYQLTTDHGPFTSIEAFGSLPPSDVGVPSDLTGPWALAAALHLGFADAPPLPFLENEPIDQTVRTRLIREVLRPPSYEHYRVPKEEEPGWNSAWKPSDRPSKGPDTASVPDASPRGSRQHGRRFCARPGMASAFRHQPLDPRSKFAPR